MAFVAKHRVMTVTLFGCFGFMGGVMLATPARPADSPPPAPSPSPALAGKVTGKKHLPASRPTTPAGKTATPASLPECWQITYQTAAGPRTACIPHEQWNKLDLGQTYQP